MAVRRASAELLAQRFLHLRISPRPTNLSESREIYRVLQRFGDISKYYSMNFEYHSPAPNSALLIYRDSSSAQAALDASPIRFSLERTQHDPKTAQDTDDYAISGSFDGEDDPSTLPQQTTPGIDDILSPSGLLTRTSPTPEGDTGEENDPPLPFAPPQKQAKTVSRWFQVTVDRSRAVHQDYVERQPFWKHFTPMKSVAQLDLARKVPHAGLSDVSKRPPHAYRTPNHVLRMMNAHLAKGQESLVAMWEAGRREGEGRR
ncbi:uncharacterized protein N0V89_002948 [Didymosphaeria variabile]|uniref:Uncharacterized protein n=1 Tax=Didymosphaeria variabile TaxID=1932322 RepID=A0A9W8XT20_9PLEO|nr:uncharacterized protein N0V89_002948 [Didymosphaeria variabile]KAJ4358366.1 hypothetical protein N0V89_002948 [Didymosphaeria variabile]